MEKSRQAQQHSQGGADSGNFTPAHQALSSSPRGHGGASNLYQCADCQRRYSRPEHLARHIQTHTLGKRFACTLCGKSFARADLLKRHAANHDPDDPSGTRKRRRMASLATQDRVSHACRACASARVRCEEQKPCTRCRNRNLRCEYTSSGAGATATMQAEGDSRLIMDDAEQNRLPQVSMYASVETSLVVDQVQQLATPETVEHCTSDSYLANFAPDHNPPDVSILPFSDFLRDVMTLKPYEASRIEEAQGLAVFDFSDDTTLELNDTDFGLLDFYNNGDLMNNDVEGVLDQSLRYENTVDMSKMRQRLTEIWMESPWRWDPNKLDHGFCEQSNLPVPSRDMSSPQFRESGRNVEFLIGHKLEQSTRDKVLAMVLSSCRQTATIMRVAASFPSAEVLDTLLRLFLASQLCQTSSWVHYGTLTVNRQWPEWLGAAVAAGAILTPISALRKFGFAVQEAVRLAIPDRWEENNSLTRDISYIQAFFVQLDIGLWSGHRRKMEISQSHSQAPIIMLRAAGKYKRSSYAPITLPVNGESDTELDEKWKLWAVQESYKRLSYHSFIRDAQTSMTIMVNPVLSYAELTLTLPCPKEVWMAKTAQEWKAAYLRSTDNAQNSEKALSLYDVLRDLSCLTADQNRVDLQFSAMIYLHAFWGMIWEYRQLEAVHRWSPSDKNTHGNTNLVLCSRQQELRHLLLQFQLISADWNDNNPLSPQETMILNLLLMNLHVSLDDLQLFAGKEGEEQAKKIYPTLQQWVEGRDARQALWHAGQVLREAKLFPRNHLKDFYAVAVHHACLTLWAYGVVTRAKQRAQPSNTMPPNQDIIFLDGLESSEIQRFIAVGKGSAMVSGPRQGENETSSSSLMNPRACMEIGQEILRSSCAGESDLLPPIVDNLCQLIKKLGNAAQVVGLG